ncbi:MAG: YraN family protein [Selenomonadaceae bacterium]|nr:YraN family protein [Selenomonadaceae bacterium]
MNTKRVGDRGEEMAADFLERKGLRILARKYRTPIGEIDLIAQEGKTLVFIEVKTRRSARCGSPAAAVGYAKQQKIARVAAWYMQTRADTPPCRFDVVEIYAPSSGAWSVRQLENAFETTW